jgi:hypothetical protein
MGRRNNRRTRTGTDIRQLWDLPKTEEAASTININTARPGPSSAAPSNLQVSTGRPSNVDMKEVRELAEHLEEIVKEAHGVLKDLRIETRQARRLMPMIVTSMIRKQVHEQIEALGKETEVAIRIAVERVNKTFDDLGKILLGTDKKSRQEGMQPLPEVIQDIANGKAFVSRHKEGVEADGQFLLGRKIGVEGNPFGISAVEKLIGEDDA